MTAAFQSDGLATEWHCVDPLRAKLRNGLNLIDTLSDKVDSSITECVKNADLLNPLLYRLAASGLKLPDIGNLREQVMEMYACNQRTPTESMVDDNAWEIRKMLRFIKRKGKRQEVSMEA